jgi:16S rRNA (uracil1498-N3)-methyltransferase
MVGPESGFSLEEIEQAKQAGAIVVSLGWRILRTETAGLAALAVLDTYC